MKTKPPETGRPAVAYYRVSTREQGTSGLGMAAQKRAVESYAAAHGFRIVESFRDIESGKVDRRPDLEALARTKELGGRLIIAKLDRLSRHAGFVLALRDSGADFVAADMPEANTLTVGIMALLAQQEREMISSRTRAALAELKARGKKLGTENLTDAARAKGRRIRRENAIRLANGSIRNAAALRGKVGAFGGSRTT